VEYASGVEDVYHLPPAFTRCSAFKDNEGGAWSCTEPKWEARCLVQLLGKNGHTVDKLRELIRVTPKEEAILRASALHSPVLVERIEQALRYRVEVAQEFERLIRTLPKNPRG
jgi:hypothetical protein